MVSQIQPAQSENAFRQRLAALAINEFGCRYFKRFVLGNKAPQGQVVFSPFSMYFGLSFLALSSAQGKETANLRKVLLHDRIGSRLQVVEALRYLFDCFCVHRWVPRFTSAINNGCAFSVNSGMWLCYPCEHSSNQPGKPFRATKPRRSSLALLAEEDAETCQRVNIDNGATDGAGTGGSKADDDREKASLCEPSRDTMRIRHSATVRQKADVVARELQDRFFSTCGTAAPKQYAPRTNDKTTLLCSFFCSGEWLSSGSPGFENDGVSVLYHLVDENQTQVVAVPMDFEYAVMLCIPGPNMTLDQLVESLTPYSVCEWRAGLVETRVRFTAPNLVHTQYEQDATSPMDGVFGQRPSPHESSFLVSVHGWENPISITSVAHHVTLNVAKPERQTPSIGHCKELARNQLPYRLGQTRLAVSPPGESTADHERAPYITFDAKNNPFVFMVIHAPSSVIMLLGKNDQRSNLDRLRGC